MQHKDVQCVMFVVLLFIAVLPPGTTAGLTDMFRKQWTRFWDQNTATTLAPDQPMWLVVHNPNGLQNHINFNKATEIPTHSLTNLKIEKPLSDHSTHLKIPIRRPPPPPPPQQVGGSLATGVLIPPYKGPAIPAPSTLDLNGQIHQSMINLVQTANMTSSGSSNTQADHIALNGYPSSSGVLIPPYKGPAMPAPSTMDLNGQIHQSMTNLVHTANATSSGSSSIQADHTTLNGSPSSGHWPSFQSSNNQFGQSMVNLPSNTKIPTSSGPWSMLSNYQPADFPKPSITPGQWLSFQQSAALNGQSDQSMTDFRHHYTRLPTSSGQWASYQPSALPTLQVDQTRINTSSSSNQSAQSMINGQYQQTKIPSQSGLWSWFSGSQHDQSKVSGHHVKVDESSGQWPSIQPPALPNSHFGNSAASSSHIGQPMISSGAHGPVVPYPVLISPANYWGSLPVIPLRPVAANHENIKGSLVADSVHHSFPTKEGFGGLPGQIQAHLTLNYVPPATAINATNETTNIPIFTNDSTMSKIDVPTTTIFTTKSETEEMTSTSTSTSAAMSTESVTETTDQQSLIDLRDANNRKRHVSNWLRIPRGYMEKREVKTGNHANKGRKG